MEKRQQYNGLSEILLSYVFSPKVAGDLHPPFLNLKNMIFNFWKTNLKSMARMQKCNI